MTKLDRLSKRVARQEEKSLLLKARIESRFYDLALYFEVNNLYK